MISRDFIKTGTISIGGIMIEPSIPALNDPIPEQITKRYKLNTQWSQAKSIGIPVKYCYEIVQNKKGRNIFLTYEAKNYVLICNQRRKLLNNCGFEYPGAQGLTLFKENGMELLFICDDSQLEVIETTFGAKLSMMINNPSQSRINTKSVEFVPTGTAIAPNEYFYMADSYVKDFLTRYNGKDKYIGHYRGRGKEDKTLGNADGISAVRRDRKKHLINVNLKGRQWM